MKKIIIALLFHGFIVGLFFISVKPVLAACPAGNLACGKYAWGSGVYQNFDYSKALDGNYSENSKWVSGGFPFQQILIDLGQEFTIQRVKLLVAQIPNGNTNTVLYFTDSSQDWNRATTFTFNQYTSDGEWLTADLGTRNNVRYVGINTYSSPSWVAWREIEVYAPPATYSCSVSGPANVTSGSTVTYTINNVSGNPAKTQLWHIPTSAQNNQGLWRQIGSDCGGNGCSLTANFSTPDSYYLVCNAYNSDESVKCSGSPWLPLPSGWYGCGGSPSMTVNVATTPTPEPPAQAGQVSYGYIENNASPNLITSWNINLPKLTSDGQFLYAMVLVQGATWHGLEIKRRPVNSAEEFRTILVKDGIFASNGGILIDKHGRLHILYFEGRTLAGLYHIIIPNPKENNPEAVTKPHPGYGGGDRGRLGFVYDAERDLIRYTVDQYQGSDNPGSYLYGEIDVNNYWSPMQKVADSYPLTEAREQDFYYPKLIIHNNLLHIFFTGSVYDRNNLSFRWMNGIYHAYRSLSGGGWSFEWIKQTSLENEYYFLQDAYVTGDNRLALLTTFHNCNNTATCQVRRTANFFSSSGVGSWSESVISSNKNLTACVQKSAGGGYHLIATYDPPDFVKYAKSADGVSWQFVSIPLPLDKLRLSLGHNCLEQDNLFPLPNAYALISGLSPSQPSLSSGHTVILGQIPSLTYNLTLYNLLISSFTAYNQTVDFNNNGKADIFDYNTLISNFGH